MEAQVRAQFTCNEPEGGGAVPLNPTSKMRKEM